MSRFFIEQTPIAGLQVIQRKPLNDDRGCLERLFCSNELKAIVENRSILQINHTITLKAGTVRGMHYQHPPHAEMKFVSCIRGEVFDVAIDLRIESPTFLNWHAEILSEQNHRTLAIPEGFAHGFQALTNDCELLYLHTAAYHPEAEDGVNALDQIFSISWPLEITERSLRDQQHPKITSEFIGFKL